MEEAENRADLTGSQANRAGSQANKHAQQWRSPAGFEDTRRLSGRFREGRRRRWLGSRRSDGPCRDTFLISGFDFEEGAANACIVALRRKLPPAFMLGSVLGFQCVLVMPVVAADDPAIAKAHFTGAQSCASSSCHGGGAGHNESLIFERKDRHAFAAGILAKGTSLRIAEALGIAGDPSLSARCTVCHSPMQAVPAERLVKGLAADRGVSCESCHGAAEQWLRFHTRKDATYQQILALGMRDMNDLCNRANVCVACHLNLDEPIRKAGHPELHFELDGQALAEPPHYKDARPMLGPRSWLTGQAVALREMSWKLKAEQNEELAARWKALVWLLRKMESGRKELPDGGDFAAVENAADRLAHAAARTVWTKSQVMALLKEYAAAHAEFGDEKIAKTDHRRRAEVLMPAIDRLWVAWKKEGGAVSPEADAALDAAFKLAREQEDFEPSKFAAALQELEKALGH